MTLTLYLPPVLEAKLRERAAREGHAEEVIAQTAIEQFLEEAACAPKLRRNILEFRGVGKHNRVGNDAQEYVNQMRDDWDHEL